MLLYFNPPEKNKPNPTFFFGGMDTFVRFWIPFSGVEFCLGLGEKKITKPNQNLNIANTLVPIVRIRCSHRNRNSNGYSRHTNRL